MSGVPRHLVVVALEALEVGDQAHAVDVLLAALEDGPISRVARLENVGQHDVLPPCGVCGVRAWPGQSERHIYSKHHERRAA